jgi:hypothetical protein
MQETQVPVNLFFRLTAYFVVLIGAAVLIATFSPEFLHSLPIAGIDAIEIAELGDDAETLSPPRDEGLSGTSQRKLKVTPEQAGRILVFLAVSLALTIALMIPITWTYIATRQEAGFRKTFVRLLITLPICATTIVLLIQDSLALAFGLAALVAAVRFRVSLQDPIDGIYVFAAIGVGLAAGIGYMGIAAVMTLFFCFANAFLSSIDYGRNALDEARMAKDRAKLDRKADTQI